jgi:hypothetical protein
MARVIHFEIQASQPQTLVDFYTALLGWGPASPFPRTPCRAWAGLPTSGTPTATSSASWSPTRPRRRPTGRKPERGNHPQPWT